MLDDKFKFDQYIADQIYDIRRDQIEANNHFYTNLMNVNRSLTHFYRGFESSVSKISIFLAMVAALQVVMLILLIAR